MHRVRLLAAVAVLAVLSGLEAERRLPVQAAPSAQTNLLLNGTFDGGFYNANGDPNLQVANSWAPWHEDSGAKSDCPPCDYVLRPKWITESNLALVQQGTSSQHVGNEFDPWHSGVFQTVNVAAGARVRFTAYLRVRASNEQYPAPSYTSFLANGQVGIDPNGAGLWYSGVTWSGTVNPHDTWAPVSVEATVGSAGKVSVYIGANWRGQTAAHLDAWFDNAVLEAVGVSPTVTPAPGQPTAPSTQTGGDVALTSFPTPTPGLDGRIVYVVKPGDTLWRIAAVAGISLEELRALNDLTTDVVFVGQQLVLGVVSVPDTPTPAPTEGVPGGSGEATPAPPATEVAEKPPETLTGNVCYLLFEDSNGNALRDAGEGLVATGQFLLANANGEPVDAYTTTADASQEPHCARELAVGAYNISVTLPAGFNPTTNTSSPLSLDPGATVNLEFGAQESSRPTPESDAPSLSANTRLRTALFGAAGVVFLLLAAGLAGFLFLSRRTG